LVNPVPLIPQIGVLPPLALAWLLTALPGFAREAAPESWYRHPAATWESLPELRRPVEGAALDLEFLAAAIFHESNRRRLQAGQLRLIDDPRARTAAGRHAATIAATGQVVHGSPVRGEVTPRVRLEAAGVAALHIGENLAMTPLRAFPEAGSGVGAEAAPAPDAEPAATDVPFRRYGDVAKAIVQQWMDSPRHRALLLSRQVSRMGCAVRFARRASGLEVVYAVQVLFDPLDPRS
jgi:uncharacterized protein YkwD